MPPIGRMNEVAVYAQPAIDEKSTVTLDMNTTYEPWYSSQNQLDTDKSDFYSEEDDTKFLIPDYKNSSRRPPVNLEWRNVSFKTREGKIILDGLNGSARSGELTAIMGPSGSGKSSLLNILTGYIRQKVSGEVFINGSLRNMRVFKNLSCYIMQDDHLFSHLTVRETIYLAACLKIPSSVSKEERNKVVDKCMQMLGLTERQDNKASQLSGGQKKRLCIAQEFVSNPPIIFLDEPTSGLDSSNCLQFIQLLKSLAEDGRTVVCTIHQPSSRVLEKLDKLYMLADGVCIYRGETQNLVPFLTDQGLVCPKYHNPTDYAMEVACGEHGDWTWKLKEAVQSMNDLIESSWLGDESTFEGKQEMDQQASTICLPQKNVYKEAQVNKQRNSTGCATSAFNQLKVLTYRNLICTLREPMAAQIRLFVHIVVGVVLGLLCYGIGNDASRIFNNSGFLFISMLFLVFTAKMPTVLTFPMEKPIFVREYLNSWYSVQMYFLAKTIVEIPFQVLFPLIYCSIVYWMTAQPNDGFRFGLFLLSSILISLVAQSIALIVSASTSAQNAVFLTPVTSIPAIFFSGFFINFSNIPFYMQWLSYTSFIRYSLQSVLLGIYSFHRPKLQCDKKFCLFQEPLEFLKFMDMADGDLYVEYAVLIGFFLVLRFIAYYILWYRVVHSR